MLPEPNFPVNPDEFIGRKGHLDAFTEALRYSTLTGRMASFAVLGDWGIGKSSLLLKLAATCSDSAFRMLPVTLSVSKDISDYMRFAEMLCDRLAHALLTSASLAGRLRAEIENWKLTRVSVGALTVDRQSRRYFLSSGSALLRHALLEAWTHFIRPAYAGATFFLDDLQNLAAPTMQDTALIVRDQFQSFGVEGINLSVCFSARSDYFSGLRSFAEPAVRFYNKCMLQQFSLQEQRSTFAQYLAVPASISNISRNGCTAKRSVIPIFSHSSAANSGACTTRSNSQTQRSSGQSSSTVSKKESSMLISNGYQKRKSRYCVLPR